MAQSKPLPAWEWTQQREEAAQLVADDRLSDSAIAARVGVSRRQLQRWHSRPEFVARVQSHVKSSREKLGRQGLADKARRIASLIEDFEATDVILAERGAQLAETVNVEAEPYAGGSRTGYITRDYRGKDGSRAVYSFDAQLLRERRELRRQIAIELAEFGDERRLTLSLPDVRSGGDVIKAVSAVLAGVAAGEITPGEGQRLAAIIESARKAIEVEDLERRLASLEQSLQTEKSK